MHTGLRTALATFALTLGLGWVCEPFPAAYASASDQASTRRADFRGKTPSADVRHIANWAVHSGDHKGLPFIVVDKISAKAVAFDRNGKLLRMTPVLIGMGVGDVFEPGVAEMNMYDTKPSQRITPAGRYFAEEDYNDQGERVLWVDYDTGIAIHKLPAKRTKQRRHERIRSPNPADHRITYGCINVPPSFYDQIVHPHFRKKGGIVYVLPDSTAVQTVFRSYDVGEQLVSSAGNNARDAGSAPIRRF